MNTTSILERIFASEAFTSFIDTYNIALTVVLAIVTFIVLVLLFFNISKLGGAADNDYTRREAINGIMVCLVCLGIVGGIDTVYAILLSFVFSLGT